MSFGDAQRLRTFALVVDLGSISAAASVLGYTQSAVSQQLAAFERELGVPLVDRSQRPLRATHAGELVRPHVERVLAAVGAARTALADIQEGMRRVRLAAFTSALSSFVPSAVRDLRRAHPDTVVQVLQLETPEATERVRAGEADLAVVHHMPGAPVPDTAGLERRALLLDELWVVMPEGHSLARRDAISVGDLDGEPLIMPRRETPAGRFRSVFERLCAEADFEPRVAYELDDLPAAQAFVAAGIGVVPMHGLTLATLRPGCLAVPLAEPGAGSRTVEAIVPAGTRTGAAADLVERLAQAARQWSARSTVSRSSGPGGALRA